MSSNFLSVEKPTVCIWGMLHVRVCNSVCVCSALLKCMFIIKFPNLNVHRKYHFYCIVLITHKHKRMHTHMCTLAHSVAYTCTHTHRHTHTCIHAHIHTQTDMQMHTHIVWQTFSLTQPDRQRIAKDTSQCRFKST